MEKRLIFIYDNRSEINSSIGKIVALNSYGDIIYKRKRLKNIVKSILVEIKPNMEFIEINNDKDVKLH